MLFELTDYSSKVLNTEYKDIILNKNGLRDWSYSSVVQYLLGMQKVLLCEMGSLRS